MIAYPYKVNVFMFLVFCFKTGSHCVDQAGFKYTDIATYVFPQVLGLRVCAAIPYHALWFVVVVVLIWRIRSMRRLSM